EDSFFVYAAGLFDIGLVKLYASGDFQWAYTAGTAYDERAMAVETDSDGNVYLGGTFSGTVDFDPGPGVLNLVSVGNEDIFYCKLDSSGNLLWAFSIGGSGNDPCGVIKTDVNKNVYFTGGVSGTVDFDPGPGVYTLSSGSRNAFLLKLDSLGVFDWVARFQNPSAPADVNDLVVTDAGSLYMCGTFSDLTSYNCNGVISTLDASVSGNASYTAHLIKIKETGSFVWSKMIEGSFNLRAHAITAGIQDDVTMGGTFAGHTDMDPGTGVHMFSPSGLSGENDAFALNLDSSGNFQWAAQIGGYEYDRAENLNTDNDGNIYITGWCGAGTDFDPGPGTYYLPYDGNGDIFIVKLDSVGAFIFAKTLATNHGLFTSSIGSAGMYITSRTNNTYMDFDPGPGVYHDITYNSNQTYILKLKPCTPTQAVLHAVACNYYWAPDSISLWMQSGIYICTIPNVSGCDSVITIFLEVYNSPQADFTIFPDTANPHLWYILNQSLGNGPLSYTWDWGDGHSTTGQTPSHIYDTAGYYNICVTVTDTNGCSATYCDSSTYLYKGQGGFVYVNVINSLETESTNQNLALRIYPNPVAEWLVIEYLDPTPAELHIISLTGAVVKQQTIFSGKNQVSLMNLYSGIYIAEVRLQNGICRRGKFVIKNG
ncbi:MAG: PKD domain-containing protein, partial [Flavobacteriales bacterium]